MWIIRKTLFSTITTNRWYCKTDKSLVRSRYLVVLQFSSNDPEGVVDEVMVDVNLWESVRRPGRDPLLVGVVVDHHRRARRRDALLWPLVTAKNNEKNLLKINLNHCNKTRRKKRIKMDLIFLLIDGRSSTVTVFVWQKSDFIAVFLKKKRGDSNSRLTTIKH